MVSSELLLIVAVAVIVFGPSKLPMLARHLGLAVGKINQFKFKLQEFWEQQVNEQQLQKNQERALKADKQYKNSHLS